MKRRDFLSLGAVTLAESHLPSASGAQDRLVLTTPFGKYEGRVIGAQSQVGEFLGIRYGHAPMQRRFKRGLPVQKFVGVQPALQWAKPCTQQSRPDAQTTEDCLFLNVWAPLPLKKEMAPRPVMVYIHGGAYSSGSATDAVHSGFQLAHREDVVVVTINHRLNVLGYLYLDRISSDFLGSGNVGQTDLILALQWIRLCIESFGGDPQCVTLFGQSGGGAKIATLMATPEADGLFHRAITMSGQQVTASGPLHASRRAEAFLKELKRDPRSVSTADLMHALRVTRDPIMGGNLYMGPVLDMNVLHRHPFWPDAAPQGLRVPMIMGNTISETRAFYPPDGPILKGLTFENLGARVASELKVDISPEWVVSEFRGQFPNDGPVELFHRMVTASRSWRGQVIQAEARDASGSPAHVYQLNFRSAKHTDDIALCLGNYPSDDAEAQRVSLRLMRRFTSFARSGVADWPTYTTPNRMTLLVDHEDQVLSDPRGWERTLFSKVPYIQPGT
jgi:para-nitrobenzyl esterase